MINQPSGCLECETGYISVFKEKFLKQQFCIQNDFLSTNGDVSSEKFVKNCLVNYFDEVQGKIRCKQCKENFLLASGKCIEITIDPALLEKIGECEIFNYYTRRCDKCKDYHFLNGGICYKGFLPNCMTYISMNQCETCETGFVALSLN